MKNMKKILAIVLAVVLLVGAVVGGTLAWFIDQTDTIENTFTVGNIDIELDETNTNLDGDNDVNTNDYKMIPGWTITKDPKATVLAGSEDCYLFVKLDKSANFDSFMEYKMAEGWIKLETDAEGNALDGVYYREVITDDEDQEFYVIDGNKVAVKATVTKALMDDILDPAKPNVTKPTLDVSAYAVQLWKTNKDVANAKFTPAEAWKTVNSST